MTPENEYGFEKLLLATGGSPTQLACGAGDIIYFRDLQDYRRLRALSESGKDFVVIGGGFIGSEIAAALSSAGRQGQHDLSGRGDRRASISRGIWRNT